MQTSTQPVTSENRYVQYSNLWLFNENLLSHVNFKTIKKGFFDTNKFTEGSLPRLHKGL